MFSVWKMARRRGEKRYQWLCFRALVIFGTGGKSEIKAVRESDNKQKFQGRGSAWVIRSGVVCEGPIWSAEAESSVYSGAEHFDKWWHNNYKLVRIHSSTPLFLNLHCSFNVRCSFLFSLPGLWSMICCPFINESSFRPQVSFKWSGLQRETTCLLVVFSGNCVKL